MHELSLAKSIARRVAEDARRRGMERVERVQVAAGILSGVLSDALAFAWGSIVTGATARVAGWPEVAGAELVLRTAPAVTLCPGCGDRWEQFPPGMPNPVPGPAAAEPTAGPAAAERTTRPGMAGRPGADAGQEFAEVVAGPARGMEVDLLWLPELNRCRRCGNGPLRLVGGQELIIERYEGVAGAGTAR